MNKRNLFFLLLLTAVFIISAAIPTNSFIFNGDSELPLIAGRNVNMVSGTTLPGGDPYLQRQNEPSIAVSTRNPMHLLAACNDYRPVNVPESEGPLPGITLKASTGPDAWLGIFKSYNGGQSWTSTLLSKDPPLHEYSTACDPTVRAGLCGLFFTSGIVFNRVEHGKSAIFVARFIDNNTQAIGDMDSIKDIDVNIIDEGTSGQFADKPWIAIDVPNYGNDTVPIESPGAPVQYVPRFNVYIVYSIFLGSSGGQAHSEIMFARSTDCGNSWEKPIKLSESVHVCQGTNIAVSPKDGKIYVVWRQYARENQGVPHAVVMCKSDDSGQTFTKATEVAPIDPFDQFLDYNRFRTSAFPALAVDHNGVVYVAWSQRGVGPYGDARIVIKTSKDGINWTEQEPVDDHPGGGHQIMPSLTYAGGMLMMTWYDLRKSLGYIDEGGNYLHHDDIADPGPTGMPHTIDTWVVQAEPSDPYSYPLENPVFTDSTQVSRYIYQAETDGSGQLVDESGIPISVSGNPPAIYQAQFSFPNFPLFIGGMAPFMGDYLDITPAPMFLYDYENGTWRFNTGEGEFDPTLFHITFACNRDVIPPREGFNWMSYWPPGPGCLDDWTAGMRNQNIYTAPITHGIIAGAPVNTKPLSYTNPSEQKRTFLVFVKNLTDYDKLIRLTIDAPGDMDASFWEFEAPQEPGECPIEHCEDRIVELYVLAHSSITLTVFVEPYSNPYETFRVNVEEIDSDGIPTGLKSSVVLNPDPVNTQMIPPAAEYHTPSITSEDPVPVNLSDPTMLSAPVVYSPYLEELLNFANPDIVTPTLRYPTLRYDTIINPTLRYSTIESIPDGQVTDIRWRVTNEGNTTSAYSFEAIGENPSVPHQLLVHRVSSTPISEQCQLSEEEHHELLLSIENPTLRYPTLRYPTLRYPTLRYNTFFLAPGEEAVITLRLIDPNPGSGVTGTLQGSRTTSSGGPSGGFFDPQFYAKTVAGAVIPQGADPDGNIEVAAFMWIVATTLPDGSVNDAYPYTLLEADGGEAPYTWSLVDGYGELPPGLQLDSDGRIWGIPSHDPPYDNYEKTYNFAVQAKDNNGQIAYRSLSIKVILITHFIEASAGDRGSIDPSGSVEVVNGFNQTFDIIPDYCYEIAEVVVDDVPQEPVPASYAFMNVRESHSISATFKKIEYTITATAGDNGTISPSGNVIVECGESQTFTISPNWCYIVADVIVDGLSIGALTSYTFDSVESDHTISATFVQLTYTITPTAGEGGSIDPSIPVTVPCGESQTFTITTDEGYQLMDVLVNGEPATNITKSAVTTYTFYNVQDDHTIKAIFKKLEAWVKRYNNDSVNGNDEANDIAVDLLGNSYVTGYSLGSPTGPDFYTVSYDGDGNVGLSARYDGPAHDGDYANAIAVDDDGNAYVTGYSFRGMAGSKHKDYCTVKYNSSRELVWDMRYDARRNGDDVAADIALYTDVTGKRFVYITGRSQDSLSTNSDTLHYDYLTIKYDEARGRMQWSARYNNASVNGADEATGIAVDVNGNVYVTGFSYNGSNNDIVTIKYGPDGNPVWSNEVRRFDAGYNDETTDIAVDTAGNVYVTGRSQTSDTGFDYITIKYDTDGNELWVARYNNDSVDGTNEAAALAVDSDGNVYVTGKSQGSSADYDYVTIKYDADGNLAWEARHHGGIGADEATGIAVDAAGDVYITGMSQGDGTGFDYLTIKYDSSGNMIWRARYNNGLLNGDDEATAIAVDSTGNVFVTGRSAGPLTGFDFATVKYEQHIE